MFVYAVNHKKGSLEGKEIGIGKHFKGIVRQLRNCVDEDHLILFTATKILSKSK